MSVSRRLIPILVAVGVVVAFGVWHSTRPAPRKIVLVSIDTLRPDQLGAYGGSPDVSPNIDALARQSALFTQVLALSPWTLPSHMTMLTGLDPIAHGVRRSDCKLSGKVVTLAESLRAAGFRTGGFTDGGFVSSEYGFGQGFEVYRDKMADKGKPNGFRRLLPEALEWMHSTRKEDSFVFIHTFDVHTPYDDGDPEILEQFRKRPVKDGSDDWQLNRLGFMWQQNDQRVTEYGRMGELANDYDAGIHEADRGVGQIIQELKDTGCYDDALIIVTSDHGESFAERGLHIGHGLALTDDELHVPLVIHLPHDEAAGRRIDTLVDLSDITPTILDWAGVPAPADTQGESLLPLLRGGERRRQYTWGESQNTSQLYLVMDGYKFITAPAQPFDDVARRHLGPMTPPGEGVEPGPEYSLGNKKDSDAPVLHYDFVGDPLGIEDTMPQTPQLYDRAKDPLELHNLWLTDVERPRADRMASQLKGLFETSMALNERLDDGIAPEPADPHHQQELEQLGYISGSTGGSLTALPKVQRDVFANPTLTPDDTLLVETDRKAHMLRLHLKDGTPTAGGVSKWLEDLGNNYILWLSQHPPYTARVVWRLAALVDLGTKAGLKDVDEMGARWRRRQLELEGRPQRSAPAPGTAASPHAAGDPADPAPTAPADPVAPGSPADKPKR